MLMTASTDVESYHVTGTSKSGIYHIGDHPDLHHVAFYGQTVKVLLVDEKTPGIYDTVYVDLNNNHDFRDDKPCQRATRSHTGIEMTMDILTNPVA